MTNMFLQTANPCLLLSDVLTVVPMTHKITATESRQQLLSEHLSFNPWFRFVSPIRSANPCWNVTMDTSPSLRYGSTAERPRGADEQSQPPPGGVMQVQRNHH